MDNKMEITVADFSFAINKAYERGFARGSIGRVAQLPFDVMIQEHKEVQAELDRRVGKALATARAKWEASLQVDAELALIPGEAEECGNE